MIRAYSIHQIICNQRVKFYGAHLSINKRVSHLKAKEIAAGLHRYILRKSQRNKAEDE
ncbi:MAG: hypothetical protein HWQ42_16015 [Nostoc sp. JL23]|uniref:hypothetical protein n=1 Tax=Nostoc sp. TaxID=1180 RepID=UPI001D3499F1|nr:hypothetical protein [Nostoc sp. JL23]